MHTRSSYSMATRSAELLSTTTQAGISLCFSQAKASTCTHRDHRVQAERPLQCLFPQFHREFISLFPGLAGEKNRHPFTSCKTSRIVTFDEVLHDVST